MSEEATADVLRRLRSVEGHIRGIERMIEQDHACAEVSRQIVAVQRALGRVSVLLLQRHLHSRAAREIRNEDLERVLEELILTLEGHR